MKIIKLYNINEMKRLLLLFLFLLQANIFLTSCSENGEEKEYYVLLTTNMGDIKVKLYNDTPGHRDNFIKLVKDKFYDGIAFHRIIDGFMIQAGDPSTKGDTSSAYIKKYRYTIPAEILPRHFHKKGVLAAARTGDSYNPLRNSSGTQFYIVEGQVFKDQVTGTGDTVTADMQLDVIQKRVDAGLKQAVFYKYLNAERKRMAETGDKMSDAELQQAASMLAYDEIAEMKPFVISPERREIYKTVGGTPHLDMQYTVFGEVVEGMDVVEAISEVKTDPSNNRPVEPVIIQKAKVVRK